MPGTVTKKANLKVSLVIGEKKVCSLMQCHCFFRKIALHLMQSNFYVRKIVLHLVPCKFSGNRT